MRNALLFILLYPFILIAQDTLTVEQLDYKFVDVRDGVTSPLTSLANTSIAGVFVPCMNESTLALCGPSELRVWVDGRLVLTKPKEDKCIYTEVSLLCSFVERDTVFLSISGNESLDNVSLRSILIEPTSNDDLNRSRKEVDSNFWLLGFIFFGFGFTFLFIVAPVRFGEVISVKIEYFSERPLTSNFLLHMLSILIFGSFCWAYVMSGNLVHFLEAFTFLLIVFLGKTLIYFLAGGLFQLKKVSRWQVVYQVRYWTIISFIVYFMLLADNLLFDEQLCSSAVLPIIGSIIIGVFLVTEIMLLSSFRDQRSLNGFIYLCSTEILPSILLIRFFLK